MATLAEKNKMIWRNTGRITQMTGHNMLWPDEIETRGTYCVKTGAVSGKGGQDMSCLQGEVYAGPGLEGKVVI